MKHKPSYPFSREAMEAYKQGTPQRQRLLEGQADPFEQDALDGWQQHPAGMESMRKLDKRFRSSIHKGWYVFGGLMVAGAILFFVFPSDQTPGNTVTEPVKVALEQSDLTIEPAIDTLTAIPVKEQIQIFNLKKEQLQLDEQPSSVPMTTIQDLPEIALEPLEFKPEERAPEIIRQKSASEIYYYDLKLIDYTRYRKEATIETEQLIVSGTPADQENRESTVAEEPVRTIISVPYVDYLKKTMSYVSRGKWKEALQRLRVILETFPDDVNAHFYAGLCSYNLGLHKDAKKHFSACLQLEFSNFNEEASWYLAQSLIANGEKDAARELLTAIANQKGYYAKQADKLLKTL